MIMQHKEKYVSDSALDKQIYQIFPQDLNPNGNLFGGRVISLMDMVAYVVASAHSGKDCVTASVDQINFLKPASLGDKLVIYGALNRAWKTSMEVGIKVCKQDMKGNGDTVHILTAYMLFVAVDERGIPVEVPKVIPQTDIEVKRYEAAEVRRSLRQNLRG